MPETDEDKVRRYTDCLINGIDPKRALKRLYDLTVDPEVYKSLDTYKHVQSYESSPEFAEYAKRVKDKLFGGRKREGHEGHHHESSSHKKIKQETNLDAESAQAMQGGVPSHAPSAPRAAVDYSKYKVTKRVEVKVEPKTEPVDDYEHHQSSSSSSLPSSSAWPQHEVRSEEPISAKSTRLNILACFKRRISASEAFEELDKAKKGHVNLETIIKWYARFKNEKFDVDINGCDDYDINKDLPEIIGESYLTRLMIQRSYDKLWEEARFKAADDLKKTSYAKIEEAARNTSIWNIDEVESSQQSIIRMADESFQMVLNNFQFFKNLEEALRKGATVTEVEINHNNKSQPNHILIAVEYYIGYVTNRQNVALEIHHCSNGAQIIQGRATKVLDGDAYKYKEFGIRACLKLLRELSFHSENFKNGLLKVVAEETTDEFFSCLLKNLEGLMRASGDVANSYIEKPCRVKYQKSFSSIDMIMLGEYVTGLTKLEINFKKATDSRQRNVYLKEFQKVADKSSLQNCIVHIPYLAQETVESLSKSGDTRIRIHSDHITMTKLY